MSEEPYTPLTKADKLPLKYACVQKEIKKYMSTFQDETPKVLWNHIQDLYNLIDYQMQRITKQEAQIVSIKHTDSWKHYDKPKEHYNQAERRYFTEEELKARNC